jgi:tetratricopeptide (TPR) repeat protein
LTGLTAILLVLATAFFSSPGGRAFVREAESIFDPRTGTNRTRIYMWEASLKMIRDHPLRGVGPGEFQYAYPAYRDPAERGLHGYNISTENPHNDYFHIGVETGIPGLLMFLGMIGWVLWDGRRRVVEARGVTLPFQLGRLCGLAGMAGAACFGFPFYMPASALLFWVIAGWPPDETGGEVASGGPSAELPKFQRSALTTVYALATVCGLAGALEGFYAVQGKTFFDFPAHWLGVTAFFWAMSVGRAMGAATPFPQKPTGAAPRISQSVSALRLSVALFLLSLFGATYAGLAGSLYRRQAKIADVQGRQATAEILYAKALGFETWNPALRFDFAQILHQLGKLDEAEQEYENTRRRHPEHEYVDRQLAEIQVQRGETEAALEFYARALRRNPNHVRARVGRGAIYLGRGDLTNAMEEFLTALESGAEKALPLYHLGLVLEKRGEYAAALARFEEALAADPNFYYAAACFNKAGALYFQAENWEKAERRFRAALDRAPGAAQPALNLALLYNKLGHRSLEREYLRRSLWAAPHQPAARSRYEQLGGDSKRIGAGETDD